MAVFTSSAFTLRRKIIVDALTAAKAFTRETALTLTEAGVENPDQFREYTERLVDMEVIGRTKDGRYYIAQRS